MPKINIGMMFFSEYLGLITDKIQQVGLRICEDDEMNVFFLAN